MSVRGVALHMSVREWNASLKKECALHLFCLWVLTNKKIISIRDTYEHYKHLRKEERYLIYLLWNKEKYSMNKISKILNKNRSTISRELKRNTSLTGIYYSLSTHKKIH